LGKVLYAITQVLKQPFKIIFPTKVFGPRKFEDNKRLILACNHASGWDPIAYTVWFKSRAHFMYKSTFNNSRFLRSVLGSLEHISVRRGETDTGAVKGCINILEQDKILAIYPEGTRNRDFDCIQEFKTGVALIALRTHSPIRPLYNWQRYRCFRMNYIYVGEQFTLEQFYDKPLDKATLREATDYIWHKVDECRIQLNEIMAKAGKHRRKPTRKERAQRDHFLRLKQDRLERQAKIRLEGEQHENLVEEIGQLDEQDLDLSRLDYTFNPDSSSTTLAEPTVDNAHQTTSQQHTTDANAVKEQERLTHATADNDTEQAAPISTTTDE